jgi:hypothetical protein
VSLSRLHRRINNCAQHSNRFRRNLARFLSSFLSRSVMLFHSWPLQTRADKDPAEQPSFFSSFVPPLYTDDGDSNKHFYSSLFFYFMSRIGGNRAEPAQDPQPQKKTNTQNYTKIPKRNGRNK